MNDILYFSFVLSVALNFAVCVFAVAQARNARVLYRGLLEVREILRSTM